MSEEVTDEEVCPACEGDGEAHDYDVCGYENEDCPDNCNVEHDVDRTELLDCPATGAVWRYCDRCGWEGANRRWYPNAPFYVHGELLCDPSGHGYDICNGCEEWVGQDDSRWSDYDECSYCSSCYSEHGGSRGREEGEERRACRTCGTANVHVNLYTEAFLCDCEALHNHALGIPVAFDTDRPVARVIAAIGMGVAA